MRRLAAALALLLGAAPGSATGSAPGTAPGTASGAGDPPPVLFDEAHAQRFLIGREAALGLSRLGEVFRKAGARVESSTAPFSAATLATARVVVISGAFAPVAAAEQDALLAFLDRGGSLAVMLHIGPPVAELLQKLGVAISTGVIRESDGVLGGNPIHFQVRRLAKHPLTAGLAGFAFYGGWALLPEDPQVSAVAETQPHSWVDLYHSERYDQGDAMQSFGVAVAGQRGDGRFVVFGDDAMFQNQVLEEGRENRELAENLAAWLLRAAVEKGEGGDGSVAERTAPRAAAAIR